MDQRAELLEAHRELLLATQRRRAAIEAWALAFTRGGQGEAHLEDLTREKDDAQAEVRRCEALIERLGMPGPVDSGPVD